MRPSEDGNSYKFLLALVGKMRISAFNIPWFWQFESEMSSKDDKIITLLLAPVQKILICKSESAVSKNCNIFIPIFSKLAKINNREDFDKSHQSALGLF